MCSVEKTLSELAEILENVVELRSFDIIPQPNASETSPVVNIEHNLGIESWCVKELYLHVHRSIFSAATIESHNFLPLLSVGILLNPDVKTFWNKRRQWVEKEKSNLQAELCFVNVVLSRRPKTRDAFTYRKWLFEGVYREAATADRLVAELKVIENVAEHFTNNYMVWDYGIWLFKTFPELVPGVITKFWTSSEKWTNSNVSDYSAVNFRQYLLKKLISDDVIPLINPSFKKSVILTALRYLSSIFDDQSYQHMEASDSLYMLSVVIGEFELNKNLILFYKHHETLWTHRRFLCQYLLRVLPSKVAADLVQELQRKVKCKGDLFESLFLKMDSSFVDKLQGDDVYFEKYEKWFRRVEVLWRTEMCEGQ